MRANRIALLAGLLLAVGLSSTITRAQQCPTPSTPPPICNFDKSFCTASTGVSCSGPQSEWTLANTVQDDVITGTQTQTSGSTTVLGLDSSSFTFIDGTNSLFDTYDAWAWPATFEVANTGTFNLQGGILTAGFEVINGVVNQSGSTTNTLVSNALGPNSQGAAFHIHCSGTDNTSCQSVVTSEDSVGSLIVAGTGAQYNLSAGTVNAPILATDSNGVFTQSGGNVNILPNLTEDANQPTAQLSSALYVGLNSQGTYNLSGGTLQVGGVFTVGTSSSEVSGKEYIGYSKGSNGIFNQTGGTNVLGPASGIFSAPGGSLYVGYNGTGTYSMSGGTMAGAFATTEYLGYGPGSTGTFNQTGGSNGAASGANNNSILELFVGYMGNGTYTLGTPGGPVTDSFLNTDFEYIGTQGYDSTTNKFVNGIGSLVQNSGTNTLDDLIVGNFGNTNNASKSAPNFGLLNPQGTYTLNGGQLTSIGEIIGDQSVGYFIQNGGNNTTQSLLIGFGNAPDTPIGVYELSGGTLTNCCSAEIIGQGSGTTGLFDQTGGTNQTLEIVLGNSGTGIYSLSGGLLDVGFLTVGQTGQQGGTGLFTQTGGTVNMNFKLQGSTTAGTLQVGSDANGTYNLGCSNGSASTCVGAGSLTAGEEEIGLTVNTTFTGTFNQYAGTTNTITPGGLGPGILSVGADGNGVYNMYGGTLTAVHEDIGVFSAAGTGTAGIFNQSGGSNTVTGSSSLGNGDLDVGDNGTGTYNLSGPSSGPNATTLSAVTENVGVGIGTGTFNQSGGSNNVSGNLTVGNGDQASSQGFYFLSGGSLSAANEIIGVNTTNTSPFAYLTQNFTQTGGSNSITDTLTIGATAFTQNAPASYGLSGGSLSAGTVNVGSAALFSLAPSISNVTFTATTLNDSGVINATLAGPGGALTANIGTLTGNGTINTTSSSLAQVVHIQTVNFNGTINLDPVTLDIGNFTLGANGVLNGIGANRLNISGDFTNNFSNMSLDSMWNVASMTLDFTGMGTHNLFIASTLNAPNLTWGVMILDAGGILDFSNGSAGLYVDSLNLGGGLTALSDICGGNIFYDKNDTANAGLFSGGSQGTYTNSCGGSLIPFLGATIGTAPPPPPPPGPTPEPSTWVMLFTGMALLAAGQRLRKFHAPAALK